MTTIRAKFNYLFYAVMFLPATLLAGEQALSQDDLITAANSASDPVLSGMSVAKRLFGSVAEHPFQVGMPGDGDSMVSTILGIINLALMAMAAVWMTWTMVKGSLMTAQEGQFIGKQMHSSWVPFRLTVGVASLVPFFKGLCFAQIVMLQAIQLSIGAGNLAWQGAVDYIYKGNDIVSVNRISVEDNLAQSVFESLLCMHSINAGIAKTVGEPNYGNGLSAAAGVWSFGSPSLSSTGFKSQCGMYKLPQQTLQTAGAAQNAANQQAAFGHLVNSLNSEAERIVMGVFMTVTDPMNNPPTEANPAYIKQAAAAYNYELKMMAKEVAATVNANNGRTEMQEKMKSAATSQGFTTAGAWFFTLSSKNNEANEAISVGATLGKSALPPSATAFIGVDDIYSQALEQITHSTTTNVEAESYDDANWIFKRIKNALCPHSNSGSLGQCIVADTIHVGDDNENALIRIANFGNNITTIGALGFTGIGAAQGFLEGTTDNILTKGAALLGGGGLKGAALGAVKPWFEVAGNAFKTLFFFGIVCATYIPLIPAIVWIMRLVSIFAIWVEAVVGAPVWAFAHLDTDGEGMGNRSGHGYLFILNVLLNPMLSVLGLVLGTVLLDIMSLFTLELYPDMISNAAGDSWTGLIKIIALLMIFVMINLSLVNLCMQLINVIPDNVMDWIGSRLTGGSLGKNGEDMVSGGAKGSLVGANWMGGGKQKQGQSAPDRLKPTVDGGSVMEVTPKL